MSNGGKYVLAILLSLIGLIFIIATVAAVPHTFNTLFRNGTNAPEERVGYVLGTVLAFVSFGSIAFFSSKKALRIFKNIKHQKTHGDDLDILDSDFI
jgi:hypothetical protein